MTSSDEEDVDEEVVAKDCRDNGIPPSPSGVEIPDATADPALCMKKGLADPDCGPLCAVIDGPRRLPADDEPANVFCSS